MAPINYFSMAGPAHACDESTNSDDQRDLLPLLCLVGVLYSVRAYSPKTDMLSLEFTSTYLIGAVTALCLSLAAVYFLVLTETKRNRVGF